MRPASSTNETTGKKKKGEMFRKLFIYRKDSVTLGHDTNRPPLQTAKADDDDLNGAERTLRRARCWDVGEELLQTYCTWYYQVRTLYGRI